MTNKDVQSLGQGITGVSHFLGPRFVGAISKNKIRIKRYVSEISEKLGEVCTPKEYKELDQKINKLRIPLCERMASKDEDGNPIMNSNPGVKGQMVYDIPDMALFHKEGEKLYGDLQTEKDKIDKERRMIIKKWEEEKSTLELYLISEDLLPDDINSNQIEGIQWMIKEYLGELTSPLDKLPEEIKPKIVKRQLMKS